MPVAIREFRLLAAMACGASFGREERYGARTLRWIVQHYHPIHTIGERPLEPAGRGVVLFERAPDAPL